MITTPARLLGNVLQGTGGSGITLEVVLVVGLAAVVVLALAWMVSRPPE